ncbi:MAG: hypothetical protein M5U26_12505 [Planctomycetota bacterium]|nr:hypothetical protein [Planctomycetota bacterium]
MQAVDLADPDAELERILQPLQVAVGAAERLLRDILGILKVAENRVPLIDQVRPETFHQKPELIQRHLAGVLPVSDELLDHQVRGGHVRVPVGSINRAAWGRTRVLKFLENFSPPCKLHIVL